MIEYARLHLSHRLVRGSRFVFHRVSRAPHRLGPDDIAFFPPEDVHVQLPAHASDGADVYLVDVVVVFDRTGTQRDFLHQLPLVIHAQVVYFLHPGNPRHQDHPRPRGVVVQ